MSDQVNAYFAYFGEVEEVREQRHLDCLLERIKPTEAELEEFGPENRRNEEEFRYSFSVSDNLQRFISDPDAYITSLPENDPRKGGLERIANKMQTERLTETTISDLAPRTESNTRPEPVNQAVHASEPKTVQPTVVASEPTPRTESNTRPEPVKQIVQTPEPKIVQPIVVASESTPNTESEAFKAFETGIDSLKRAIEELGTLLQTVATSLTQSRDSSEALISELKLLVSTLTETKTTWKHPDPENDTVTREQRKVAKTSVWNAYRHGLEDAIDLIKSEDDEVQAIGETRLRGYEQALRNLKAGHGSASERELGHLGLQFIKDLRADTKQIEPELFRWRYFPDKIT